MLEEPNAEMCDLCSLCPKDVTLESMDLSDRVRMWMLLNMIAQKTGNLSKM